LDFQIVLRQVWVLGADFGKGLCFSLLDVFVMAYVRIFVERTRATILEMAVVGNILRADIAGEMKS
jgi:hypothetical protein